MKLGNLIWGRPLSSEEEGHQRVGLFAGFPLLGLDGLSSSAYGTEAALSVLMPLGVASVTYLLPITGIVLGIMAILLFSYRQTIAAYPNGGGSYTVAKENLGRMPGLLAAAALMIDYILVVSIGVSAGVDALVSAIPSLHEYVIELCLVILVLITMVNLRGAKESGLAFAIPTYLFIVGLIGVLVWGTIKAFAGGGHATPMVAPPPHGEATHAVSIWILMKAFSSGCAAMTGVEAVSNGTPIFRPPMVKNAQRTLAMIVLCLSIFLAGTSFLAQEYKLVSLKEGTPGYQSMVAQLIAAVAGRGPVYYTMLGLILMILCLSANTGFVGFPRLCRMLAIDDYLPHAFAARGRRLVFTYGIVVLAMMAGILLIAFKGHTTLLIPLYAVGAFLAFTLSQAGMVVHWKRLRQPGWKLSMWINGLGCFATGTAMIILAAAKFMDGAWVTVLLVPLFVVCFIGVRRHYHSIARQTHLPKPMQMEDLERPFVIVPFQKWSTISERAIRFAMNLSDDVVAIHIAFDEHDEEKARHDWHKWVEKPLLDAGRKPPTLKILHSPYRRIISVILDYIREVKKERLHGDIAIIIPELVEARWYHHFMHNQRATALKAALLFGGDNRTMVINIPWHAK